MARGRGLATERREARTRRRFRCHCCATRPQSLAIDAQGNAYLIGLSFSRPTGGSELLVAKYDASGTRLWRASPAGSAGYAVPGSIVVDGGGNAYVTGQAPDGYTNDPILAKYDAAGSQQWAIGLNRAGAIDICLTPNASAVDAAGNTYVTCSGSHNSQAGSTPEFLTLKCDAAGNIVWRAISSTQSDTTPVDPTAVAVDASGNAYVTGSAVNGGQYFLVTLKYDPSGSEIWRATGPATNIPVSRAEALAVDGGGNVYVTGQSYNGSNFDFLTIKYDAAGVEQWRVTGNDPLNDDFAAAIGLAPDNSIYVAGTATPQGQPEGIMLQKIAQGTSTATALASSPNPSMGGQPVTLTATIKGSRATGTVDFLVDGKLVCAGVPVVRNRLAKSAKATCATPALTVGTHSITAVYSGDARNAGSTSLALLQTVTTGVVLRSSRNPSPAMASVTFTASVMGRAPTGAVTFKDGSTVMCASVPLQGGGDAPTASCTSGPLAKGLHSITAQYGGDANNAGATSPALKQNVTRTRR